MNVNVIEIRVAHTSRAERAISPEQSMFTAIIMQALYDLALPGPAVQDEAWHFLTDERGGWAKSRANVCDAIGVDPAALRDWVLRKYESPASRRARVSAAMQKPAKG